MKMKKMMMMAVMAVAATSAFAQDALVKEAAKQLAKGEFDEAIKTVTPATTSAETTDKAAAWNTLSEAYYQKFSKIQQQEMENRIKKQETVYDTLEFNKSIGAAIEAAIKCDEFDTQANDKGKVKVRFRKANQDRWTNAIINLINSGLYMYNQKMPEEALKHWTIYVDAPSLPLFEGVDFSKNPTYGQYRSEIAYYAGLVAYQKKDYPVAEKYARIAAEDPKKADEANEILLFSQKENCKTAEDSLAYVATLKNYHAEKPTEERYFNLLMDYYSRSGNKAAMKQWAEEEVQINAENKMAWALKGEVLMGEEKWDEAVECYKKAAEIDPSFIQCVFNAGVCLYSKAAALKEKLADKKTGGLTNANAEKVKAILRDALVYQERARELDPEQEKVKWAYPLYQIYYAIGNNAKASEMEKLLENK